MSDSELSDPSPDEATIEAELRDIVQKIYVNGNLEELTVKRVRVLAEKNLGLEEGFLKEAQWKDRSKAIIEQEASQQDGTTTNTTKITPKKATKEPPNPTKATKRSAAISGSKSGHKKRQKKEASPEKSPPVKRKAAPETKKQLPETSGSELSALESDTFADDVKVVPEKSFKETKASTAADQSESEMSQLIDDEPKPKRKKGTAGGDKKDPKKQKQKQKKETPPDLDPDAAEIKKLQGWLVKCGIRKMWWKELKPYETPKAKMKHLKEMLSDVGMTGRYSAEKATQIREARELQADLEAVQEGEKYWGKAEEEEVSTGEPKRRLARGLQNLDFLDDDEGEETG